MMRKQILLLSLAAMVSGSVASARSLSPAEALSRAGVQTSVSRSGSAVAPVMTVGTAEAPALYVFNKPAGGWVILAADDVAAPVIGYSDSGSIEPENLPVNFRGWLDVCKEQIVSASAAGASEYDATSRSASREPIEPLVKTKWNQAEPYNILCPHDGYTNAVTGCVATAMAQVMNYYKWPETVADNVVLKNTFNGVTLTENFSGIKFDWDNMLDTYDYGKYTDAQGNAVAKLMQACGFSVDMRYSIYASAAMSEDVGKALVQYFKYDGGLHNEPRDLYTTSQWEELIYNNLIDFGPIVYWGQGDGGHCFVCDGYDGKGYFHFNWGWSGMSDGYYLLNMLNPLSQGIGGSTGGYNSAQGALLGVKKASTTDKPHNYTFYMPDGITGVSVNNTYIYIDGLIKNYSPFTANGKFVLHLYNEDGSMFIKSCPVYAPLANNYGRYDSASKLTGGGISTLEDGTYRVYAYITIDGNDYPIQVPPGYPSYAILKREKGRFTASLPEVGAEVIDNLSTNGDFFVGKPYKISGIARFTGEAEKNLYVQAALLNPDGSVRATGSALTLAFTTEGTPFEFVSDGWFNDKGLKITPGEWTFAINQIIDGKFKTLATCPVTVRDDAPTRGDYEVSKLEVENAEAVDPMNINITAHVKGTKGVVYEDMCFTFMNGMLPLGSDKRIGFYVSEGQETTVNLTISIPNAKQGDRYRVRCYQDSPTGYVYKSEYIYFTIGDRSGIADVEVDGSEAPVEYFNLQGIRVDGENLAPGIYIRRQGDKVDKIIVR